MGDLSNAIALVGRVPFLTAFPAAIFSEMCDLAGKTRIASKQQQATSKQSKHIALSRQSDPSNPGLYLQRDKDGLLIMQLIIIILCEA